MLRIIILSLLIVFLIASIISTIIGIYMIYFMAKTLKMDIIDIKIDNTLKQKKK